MKLGNVPRYYDRAARRYDQRLGFWFDKILKIGSFRLRAVESLGKIRGAVVLDVGCGTGANLPLPVPRVGSSGVIIGIGYSEGLLTKA